MLTIQKTNNDKILLDTIQKKKSTIWLLLNDF